MKTALTLLVAMLALRGPASAQTSPPATSFEDLPKLVKLGQEIDVRDETGRRQRGELVSITGGDLKIEWRSLFRSHERSYTHSNVTQIDIVDSLTNGSLIGTAIGGGATLLLSLRCVGAEPECVTVMVFWFLPIFLTVGGLGGWLVDDMITQPIYIAPQPTRVTISPVFGTNRLGVAASFRF